MELAIKDIQRQIDELKSKLEGDKFKDLKQAFAEGAIIEYANSVNEYRWVVSNDTRPDWTAPKYRIKGNISISSWNAHKDIIKQYWNDAEIEVKISKDNWVSLSSSPNWSIFDKYRIKQDKWKLPEYEDGDKWIVVFQGSIYSEGDKDYTKVGRRRATEKLAERCAKASKERDLLEAYRDHLEPDYVDPDWGNLDIDKYYIYICRSRYFVGYNFSTRDLGKVYGSRETMQKICDALNNGSISL